MVKQLFTGLFTGLFACLLLAHVATAQTALPQSPGGAKQPALQAFVDRTHITLNDVITLTMRLDASMGDAKPSFTGLNQNFEQVGGMNARSTYTNTNGNIQAWTEYSIMLRPLNTGTLTIPAFKVGKETTQPIPITVTDAKNGPTSDDEIFLRVSLNKKESYVQEQLLFTAKLYYSITLDQGAKLSPPEVENAVVQQLGSDNNLQEVVNGISYNVVERRYVIFPQQSGTLKIKPLFFTGTVGRLGGINRFVPRASAIREINLSSDPISITIKPQPDTFDGTTWLPASSLKLDETWSGDLSNVHVGDAVTRNITITATGLSSSLLPGITYKDLNGLRFYPDQPVRDDSANADGVVGKRKEGTAIVASQPGDFLLPEVKLAWWNTKTDRMEYATLPSKTIKVLPALNAPDANGVNPTNMAPAQGQGQIGAASDTGALGSNPLWISTTVVFATLWLATMFLWLRNRQQLAYVETTAAAPNVVRMPDSGGNAIIAKPASIDASMALRVLKTACDNKLLPDIRKAALKWGQATFDNAELMTLDQLATVCNDNNLSSLLSRLDQALYGHGEGSSFDAQGLYERVALLHKQGFKPASGDKYALRPLYKA